MPNTDAVAWLNNAECLTAFIRQT